jgi:hypothetical protein
MRVGVILLLAALLAGCVTTAENTLSPERRAALKIESVKVTFAPNAGLSWADAESEFDRAKLSGDGTAAYLRGEPQSGEKRAFVEKKAAAKITQAFQNKVLPSFHGTEPARLEIVVKSLDIPSTVRQLMIGGNHTIGAEITVVNARSGELILRAPDFRGQSPGTGAYSLVVDRMLDPIDRATVTLADNFRSWLESGSQMGQGLL